MPLTTIRLESRSLSPLRDPLGEVGIAVPDKSGNPLADGVRRSVGSPNFDNRSFRLQFEINAIVVDEAFGRDVEAMLVADMARSKPWDPADLAEAPFFRRLWDSIARLTAPIL